MTRFALTGAAVFDGETRREGHALVVADGRVDAILPEASLDPAIEKHDCGGVLVAPGLIDLQVNGGGGVLLNNDPTVDGILTILAAHARFGSTALLPTLITDTPEVTARAIEAGIAAWNAGLPGFLGLHIEGPHLSLARKGTHDPALIRPMDEQDLARLVASSGRFGHALITVAPESVTREQVAQLRAAGWTVSLGHTDCDRATASAYVASGATMATHLFNAMSQLGNREPGLVGAALAEGAVHAGLIADGFHVDPVSMGVALRAKTGPGRIFLVTDAMSTIGTGDTGLELNGRQVFRKGGRLTLADGTLAGADIDLIACVRKARDLLGLPLEEALRMASAYPADAIGVATKGRLLPGSDADFIVLTPELDIASTWIAGQCIYRR